MEKFGRNGQNGNVNHHNRRDTAKEAPPSRWQQDLLRIKRGDKVKPWVLDEKHGASASSERRNAGTKLDDASNSNGAPIGSVFTSQ
jgi:hypothetical protein